MSTTPTSDGPAPGDDWIVLPKLCDASGMAAIHRYYRAGFGEVHERIHADRLALVREHQRVDALAALDQTPDDVGQVVLLLGVVVRELRQMPDQIATVEGVHA